MKDPVSMLTCFELLYLRKFCESITKFVDIKFLVPIEVNPPGNYKI